jgi:hypothetical protein
LAAVAAFEQKLKAGPATETQREYDETLERLIAGLKTLSREIANATDPEEAA